ncbi:Dam family site-specific DNA-(adenine-N6)-methyltransferase [Escherichia coli]|nr:Dam family site-specific DNA-(adenine-N6)-methyltransferase [Escherichia coli]MBC6567264.1 Dam family site-specific DNA-(adenine-N6)-methyltransferase [Escherichia coli]
MKELCYGSVCSGIEAASIAWEPLGMRPVWFAEIEPFPSAVLALRWPHVANLGDMTKLAKKVLAGEIESPDVLVGGTPCFTAGHMVLCKNGYKPIEDVCPGDYVVSHLGRLQQVKRVGSKIANTGLLNAVGQPLGIRTTNDHPFLAVRWKAQNTRKNGTYFKRELLSEPEWRAACDMPGYQWCALTNFNIASPDICSRFLSEEAGFRINSVSPALAWGVAGLSQTCGYVSSVSFIEVEPKKVIEDRVVNQRNYYQVTICPQKLSRKSRLAHGMLLRTVKEFKSVGLDTVYNIEVEGDHSYILNGVVVHNCQAFSIAGLRGGLDDERGALTLKYVELANAIDDKRAESFLKPAVIVWENVPGVLSSADNAFGCFLAGLAGEDAPFEPGDRPESGKSNAFWRWDVKTGRHAPKWPQCGCIYGPQRKVAWRILDAQYFGVAQRRRRVFVVASARTDLDPATVLFEFEGVRRNIAPSRDEGKETTRYTSNIAIRTCDDTNIIAMAHGQGGAEIKTDNSAPTLTCNHEAPIVLLGDGRMRRLTPVECERLQGFPDWHTLIPTGKRKKVSSDELAYLRNNYPDLNEEEAAMLAADGPRYKAIGNSMAIPVMRWIGDRITKAACRQNEGSETKERKVKPAAEFERSIFKWVGGKFGVLEQIFRYLPEGKRLIEPFVGGGAVFMNAGYQENLLNDVNADLINFYKTLQREEHSLITLAHRFFLDYNTQEGFLAVRNAFNKQVYDDLHRAAAFLFLNRHCFNGLTRYNQAGEFNVGYGKYKSTHFPLQEMEAFLGAEGRSEFVCGDFAAVIEAAGEGDVIFCDPPYEPLPNTEGFTNYSGHDFKFEEQKRLVSLLTDAHRRGAKVLITNSGAPNIRELYQDSGFRVEPLFARRSVSCKGDTRGVAHDVMAILL